jgi:DNA/RNA-binding domain of Phe-tRNA-synthetase-like protein
MSMTVAPEVASLVRPAWCVVEHLVVRDRDARQDEPLARAAAAMRTAAESADITAAVRTMYKRVGIDPTKTRPSSEALLRRVRKGDALPRINSLVDIINWTSLESQLSFGLYDADRLRGDVTLRLGRDGEEYAGIRKDVVHLAGRLVLSDEAGPFGNPTSDSARTMVTTATARALVVIFVPVAVPVAVGERALVLTRQRIDQFCVD